MVIIFAFFVTMIVIFTPFTTFSGPSSFLNADLKSFLTCVRPSRAFYSMHSTGVFSFPITFYPLLRYSLPDGVCVAPRAT